MLLLLGLDAGPRAYAQAPFALDPSKAPTQYVHQVWQVDEGLPQATVRVIVQTQDGYLWMGTEEGLARFDGVRFQVFDKSNTAAFDTGDSILALFEDRAGTLWIGTDGGSLVRYSDGQFIQYARHDGLPGEGIKALLQDRAGDLWIGTLGSGLFSYRDKRFAHYMTEDGLSSNLITTLLQDRAGTLWVGTSDGVTRIENGAATIFRHAESEHDNFVLTLHEDRDGVVLVGTREGLSWVDGAHLVPRDKEWVRAGVRALWEDAAGNLWVGLGQGGLGRLRDGRFEAFSTEDGLSHGRVLTLFGDREGSLWIGTEGGGLNRLRDGKFTTYTFRVKARNNDGVWNETGASVAFTLKPFFYQTGWFYALAVLAVFLVAFVVYHGRTRQLRTRKRELEALVETHTLDLRTAKEKIEAQAEKLQELDRFKTRFFANVSHEFRTPLTMIIGPLENALQGAYGALTAPVHRQVEIMLRNALRLMRLINQLLDLSKLEAGKMQLQARPRNIVSFLEGVVLSCSAFTEQKKIALDFHTDPDKINVFFEPDKLEKVFFNLLSNAVKFTPAGGEVVVTVTGQPSTPGFAEGAVEVRVRDTGVGIPSDDLPYIFDRFHQVDHSNTREPEGTGIGLALVQELVLLHHGAIHVYSEVGVGTEFVVALPLGAAHLKREELASRAADEEAFGPELDPLSELAFSALSFMPETGSVPSSVPEQALSAEAPLILVVEDNADVREFVASILGRKYRVETAQNGEEGLEKARQGQPDLIVSDVMMPRMDGTTMCRVIKSDPKLNHIPVVLMTARATEQMKIESLEVGADDYLTKPINARELMARAKNLIQLRQQKKELQLLNEYLERKVEKQIQVILCERMEYEEKLLSAKEQAEQSLQIKTTILDNMNHEFRTPVAAIQGYAQILSSEVEGELKEFASLINQSGGRLMRTLEAVQQLSRLEANDFKLNATPLNLAHAAREAQQRFAPIAAQKGLSLRIETPTEEQIEALLDASAIERILDYLLDNAIKFTEEGEVVLEVGRQADRVMFSVRDTGVGIDQAFLPHLFKAFTQESTGLTRSHEGIGIGLTVAKRLVDLLDGSITVESEKGQGTVFTVKLPASPPARQIPARMIRRKRAS